MLLNGRSPLSPAKGRSPFNPTKGRGPFNPETGIDACSGVVCISGGRTPRGRLRFAAPCAALTARVYPCGSLLVRGAFGGAARSSGPFPGILCCCFRPARPQRVAGLLARRRYPRLVRSWIYSTRCASCHCTSGGEPVKPARGLTEPPPLEGRRARQQQGKLRMLHETCVTRKEVTP